MHGGRVAGVTQLPYWQGVSGTEGGVPLSQLPVQVGVGGGRDPQSPGQDGDGGLGGGGHSSTGGGGEGGGGGGHSMTAGGGGGRGWQGFSHSTHVVHGTWSLATVDVEADSVTDTSIRMENESNKGMELAITFRWKTNTIKERLGSEKQRRRFI